MKSRVTALIAVAGLATGALAVAAPSQAAKPTSAISCKTPPAGTDAQATAKGLAVTFFTLLQSKDRAGLSTFLNPAFISVDGKGVAKTRGQLVNGLLPNIKKFKVSRVNARLDEAVLTSHYLVLAAGDINGSPYSIKDAPRLSTFTFCTGTWQMTSHANFDPLRG